MRLEWGPDNNRSHTKRSKVAAQESSSQPVLTQFDGATINGLHFLTQKRDDFRGASSKPEAQGFLAVLEEIQENMDIVSVCRCRRLVAFSSCNLPHGAISHHTFPPSSLSSA